MERNGLRCTHVKVTSLSISLLSPVPAVSYLARFMQFNVVIVESDLSKNVYFTYDIKQSSQMNP